MRYLMWRNDIKEIKEWMDCFANRLIRIEGEIIEVKRIYEEIDISNLLSARIDKIIDSLKKIE